MTINRRSLLKRAAAIPLATVSDSFAKAAENRASSEKADYTIRVATGLVELSPEHIVSTTLYNGQFPGPLVRLTEGKQVFVDIYNDTDTPEQLHWHGQFVPVDVDGAAEEGTPYIPAHGMRRIAFVPKPSAFRFYHTHVVPMNNLSLGTYTGQAGPVYIEPANNPGAYDREVFLALKEFLPSFSQGGDMEMDFLAGAPIRELQDIGKKADEQFNGPKGYEVGYDLFGINGKMLGHGDPIRVKQGERVLFHVLNASAGEIRSLALPGHTFRIVALDGNPIPTPADVPVLWLGTAERISAIVEMNHPGIWVMGDLDDDDRGHGMGPAQRILLKRKVQRGCGGPALRDKEIPKFESESRRAGPSRAAVQCLSVLLCYPDLFVRNNRHEEMRIIFASGVNHMHAGVDGLGMPGQHDPASVFVDIAPLHDDAKPLPCGKAGAGRPNFDVDRYRNARAQFQLSSMQQPWLVGGGALRVQFAVGRAQPTERHWPVF